MNITTIDNVELILELIPNLKNHTLLILDIDEVLIMPKDDFRLDHKERVDIIKEYSNKYNYEQRKHLFSIILQKQEMCLVDVRIIDVLESLRHHTIPTIAITRAFTGKFGIIDSAGDLLISRLNKLNIDFKNLSPIKEEILIKEMTNAASTLIFKNGILMTANQDKGQALDYLLIETDYYPQEIIFIDDKLENLESLYMLTNKLGMKGQYYEYVGAKNVPLSTLNANQEKLRFEILEYQHQWLTDAEISIMDQDYK